MPRFEPTRSPVDRALEADEVLVRFLDEHGRPVLAAQRDHPVQALAVLPVQRRLAQIAGGEQRSQDDEVDTVTRRRPATAEFDAGRGLADEGADEVGPEDGAGAAFNDDLDRFPCA